MTSGTFDYFHNSEGNAFLPLVLQDIYRKWTAAEIVSAVAAFEPVHAPGEGYGYSNTDYLMLGTILEAITGQPLHAVLEARIFEPLGLDATYLAGAAPHSEQLARGYPRDSAFLYGQEGPLISDASHYAGLETVFGAAGGLVSTSGDLARGLRSLLSGDVLDAPLRAQMLGPTPASLDAGVGYGYGAE